MITHITEGVKVSIETIFQPEYSDPHRHHFMYAYRIRIENMSDYDVKLLRRQWYIVDSNGTKREVEGEGVVGQQPVIGPGEFHEYVSGCHLNTDFGNMWGSYKMKRQIDGSLFDVTIPKFALVAPFRLN